MSKQRADLGFGNVDDLPEDETDFGKAIDDFDIKNWSPPASSASNDKPDPLAMRQSAEASGFRSRDPHPTSDEQGRGDAPPITRQRRRRTGRDTQMNLKVRAETKQAFFDLADANDWILGEAFEYALAALQRELESRS